jgi:thiamine biosynthesis protein ThiS
MIEIHVRLHGALRDKLPPEDKGRTTLTLPDGASLTAVLEQLSLHRHIEVAVNDEIVDNQDIILQDGDRVEIFRPAAGGSRIV